MKKGFSLIEILVSVIIVAVVATVAFPLVKQYRVTCAQTAMQDDGARIGIAALAYFAETQTKEVELSYNAKSGAISAPEAFAIPGGNRIAADYDIPGGKIVINSESDAGFELASPLGGVYSFDKSGKFRKARPYSAPEVAEDAE